MTVEASLYTALSPLVAGRVYPDIAPAGVALPYITYQQVGGVALAYLDKTPADRKNGRLQINVWAATRAESTALILQAETALTASTSFQASPIGAHANDYEQDTKYYGALQDFSIWSAR
jgi:hypothetical protein